MPATNTIAHEATQCGGLFSLEGTSDADSPFARCAIFGAPEPGSGTFPQYLALPTGPVSTPQMLCICLPNICNLQVTQYEADAMKRQMLQMFCQPYACAKRAHAHERNSGRGQKHMQHLQNRRNRSCCELLCRAYVWSTSAEHLRAVW